MIYSEDAIRLSEAAANFHRILEMFRNDEGDPDGNDISESTVSAFAREAATQAGTIDGPTGTDPQRLGYVRPLFAARVVGLLSAIRALAHPEDRRDSWNGADQSEIDRLGDEIKRMADYIEDVRPGLFSSMSSL